MKMPGDDNQRPLTCVAIAAGKNIKNRKPKFASERPSARGRDFAQPIAYLFTHLST